MTGIFFLVFAALAVFCGVNVVLRRHPISSALWLIGVMGSLAVLYLQLGAEFIAAAQVIVYAGAVMVLFVIVIMLLNAEPEQPSRGSRMAAFLGIPLLLGLLAALSYVVCRMIPESARVEFGAFTRGTARDVGEALFKTYLLPFEITSILVLIALIGAVVLTYKRSD